MIDLTELSKVETVAISFKKMSLFSTIEASGLYLIRCAYIYSTLFEFNIIALYL